MSVLRYISHPNVVIDPDVDIPRWGLSDIGRRRFERMLAQPWVPSIGRIVTSTETKAVEAGTMLAEHLGLAIEQREASGENDRSATGYVPHEQHEALADRFFGWPHQSADGWERAVDAQRRVVDALADLVSEPVGIERWAAGDVAVIGHGGVGTLLYCHLAGEDIDRRHDQPGQGHYWTYDRSSGTMAHGWRSIDILDADRPAR
ncbi:MAG: histidine phosphatase family protein [Actinomycetota bacterium]